MDELITKIEETVSCLLQYDLQRYAVLARETAGMMMTLFPAITDSYKNTAMEEFRDDAAYWPEQLQRVIDALGNGDYFEVTDVLFNETRPNLIELKGILEQKGIL